MTSITSRIGAWALALVVVGGASIAAAGPTPAPQYGRQAGRPAMSLTQVQQILTRIRSDAGALRRAVEQTAPRGRAAGNPRAARSEDILYRIDDVVQASNEMSDRLLRTRATGDDADDVLRHGVDLDAAITSGPASAAVTTAWMRLRRSLEDLASVYSSGWDWRNPRYHSSGSTDYSRWFTGTYRLSPSDSDDPRILSQRALQSLSNADRARISRQIEYRLTPPDLLSISRQGDQVTIASSQGPQTTFDADGQSRIETGPGGRVVSTRATARGDELEVSTSGTGGSDFSVTFQATDNGRTLVVTRRLYNDALRDPVVVRSFYRRTADVADWNVYDVRAARSRVSSRASDSAIVVPTGTTFVASLDRAINLRTAREGDRIALTVESGNEFSNARIEGYVTSEPTRASNRTGLSIAFDQIQLRDGRSGDFDGTIQGIRDANGRNIAFDRSERVDRGDRTDEAVTRGAFGAALGAVLGAVIGGGKGAAIGAAIGATGGAGTVFIDNPNQTDLPRGTMFTIRSETLDIR